MVVLPVFQKELLLLSKNIRVSDKVWVGGDGNESQGSNPSLSQTTWRHGLSSMVICRTYQNLCQSSHPLKTDLGERLSEQILKINCSPKLFLS